MAHQCPAPGCTIQVPDNMLACRHDWYRLPKPIRSAIWAAWDNGAGEGSPEHRRAVVEALVWYDTN